MSDLNKLTNVNSKDEKPAVSTEQNNAKRNKKIILWAILVVVVLIVLYVLFGDNVKQFRLCTETRKDLVNVGNQPVSSVPVTSVASETSLNVPSSISLSADSASAVRRELANLFKSYA